jgi:hypothetical protein
MSCLNTVNPIVSMHYSVALSSAGVRRWNHNVGQKHAVQTSHGGQKKLREHKHLYSTPPPQPQPFKIHTFLNIKHLHNPWVFDAASFCGS